MKNLLVILLLLAPLLLKAQNDFNFGLTLGGGYGSFSGDSINPDASSKFAPVFGLSFEKQTKTNLFFGAALTYGQKKMEVDIPSMIIDPTDPTPQSNTAEFGIDATTLPLYIGYKSDGDLKFLIKGGPYLSIISKEENILVESFDYGLIGAIGLEYELSIKGSLRFEIQNELGLADINGSEIDSNKITTNRIGAYLTYLIEL